MRWVLGLLILVLMAGAGCASSDETTLPPITPDPTIPITINFEECAKYYPVMESYPRQCRDEVSGKTFTEIICSEGEIRTAECPDGLIYDYDNCVDGRWVTINYIRNPCD